MSTEKSFRDALIDFRRQVPTVIVALQQRILEQKKINLRFREELNLFFDLCKQFIHLRISQDQIQELLIQHILTEDIFILLFDDADFYHFNPIARQAKQVIACFWDSQQKKSLLKDLNLYYQVIGGQAAQIQGHKPRQQFLKVVYENFYIACHPKTSDKLGVVYTPNEIVHFMVQSADYLSRKHFKKSLSDKNVQLLDPATGTGTFIVELIDFLQSSNLHYKYENEIFAHEIAILPYYIAHLNIEYSYQQRTGNYTPFLHTRFEDTLETPIRPTNKISIILGNPPYNANQQSENDNNKNHTYPFIDSRIKETYIKNSTAQKTKQYDMYKRFIRWASDQITHKGMIAFIVNRSFIDKRQDDGFRASVSKEFDYCYILDLGGDVRNGDGAKGNVFGIMLGVAIIFLVKKTNTTKNCTIHYFLLGDQLSKKEKLDFLAKQSIEKLHFDRIRADSKNNWIHQAQNDWETLLPLCNRNTKTTKQKENENAIFKTYTNGVNTARDAWVYDFNPLELQKKVRYFIDTYNQQLQSGKIQNENLDYSIKWSNTLKRYLRSKQKIEYQADLIIEGIWRPFIKKYFYAEKKLNDRLTQKHYAIFGKQLNEKNTIISLLSGMRQSFSLIANNLVPNLAFFTLDPAQNISQFIFDKKGNRSDNITDWGYLQFRNQYSQLENISKDDIFHYIYAVLHCPAYRKKYEQNLKNDFPRIPFYTNFYRWVNWGKQLLDLHLNYERLEPYPLKVIRHAVLPKSKKTKLKANKKKNEIIIDETTFLSQIPSAAWNYQLGNRSALEWILDQYKERKTVNSSYQLADYKEVVIELLKKITRLSLQTVQIIAEMN